MTALRILVLVHEYPPIGGGGGRVAQEVARGLAARGHHLRVLTSHYRNLPRRAHDLGVEVWRVPACRRQAFRAGLGTMSCYVAAAFWQGWILSRTWRPHVIHAHFAVPAGAAAWALSRVTGIPYVLTAHLGDVPGGVPEKTGAWFRWVYPFSRLIWRAAARITAVSEYTAQLARAHYPVDVRVIPNGVDVAALRPRTLQVANPPRIVFAGRFVPQKNPLAVVETLARLRDLPWHCTMLGDGPLRSQIQAAIQQHGLQERFTLPGWVTPEEVLETFERSDILFMPSRQEGLPVVGLQALAKGLVIVAGKAGGFVEIAEASGGYVLEPDDVAGFAAVLRALLAHPEDLSRRKQRSLQAARQYDLNRVVVPRYEEVLQEAATRQKG